jgi:serpin B
MLTIILPLLTLACTPEEATLPDGASDSTPAPTGVGDTGTPDLTEDTGTTGTTGTTEVAPPSEPPGVTLSSDLPRNLAPTVDDAALAAHVAGLRQFGSALHPRLAAPTDDLVFSPWSLSLVLAMAYAGAETTAEAEMAAVCRFDLPEPDLHAAFDLVDLGLAARDVPDVGEGSLTLRVVNTGFVNPDLVPVPAYLDTLALYYGTGLQALSLRDDPQGSADAINAWVEAQTEGQIPTLVAPESLVNAALALVNAVYFAGTWDAPFHAGLTRDAGFHLLDGSVVQVPTMQSTEGAGYAQGAGWAAVSLDYVGRELSMLIVVPDDLAAYEAQHAADLFADPLAGVQPVAEVVLSLPRFGAQTTAPVGQALEDLGMVASMAPGADFSGLTAEGVHIGDVVHEAVIGVDESGTEAAAASAVIVDVDTAGSSAPPVVNVDRPFLFAIVDGPTGALLFQGRITDPR